MLSHKHLCLLDGQPELGNEAFKPVGKSMRLYKGGGGGGQAYYGNLNKLYKEQANQARLLGKVAEETVIPTYQNLMADAETQGNVFSQELNANRAGEEYGIAAQRNRDAMAENFASMGVNPNDERFMRAMSSNATQDAMAQAGAINSERNRTRDLGFARRQDLVGMGLGLPGQSAQAFGAAANGQAALLNQQQQYAIQQQQMQNSALSNAVSGGVAGYGMYRNFKADGGLVTKSYADGGFVRRGEPQFAGGGFVGGAGGGGGLTGGGFTAPIQTPSAPPSLGIAQYKPSVGEKAVIGASAGMQGAGMGQAVGSGLTELGLWMNGANTAAGAGTAAAGAGTAAAGAGTAAAGAGTAAAGAGTAAAGGAAAGGAAAGAGTAAAGGAAAGAGALGAIGAAMPYVGAALLVDQALFGGKGLETALETAPLGNALGLPELFGYADGGEVGSQRVNGLRGGEVDGPGGPTDDLIPAWLSDGEFVMTAEAVQHFGLDKLNKMNQVGLAIRNGTHGKSQSKEKAA